MLYPITYALQQVLPYLIVLCAIGFMFHKPLARLIGRWQQRLKHVEQDTIHSYRAGQEEEGQQRSREE